MLQIAKLTLKKRENSLAKLCLFCCFRGKGTVEFVKGLYLENVKVAKNFTLQWQASVQSQPHSRPPPKAASQPQCPVTYQLFIPLIWIKYSVKPFHYHKNTQGNPPHITREGCHVMPDFALRKFCELNSSRTIRRKWYITSHMKSTENQSLTT